MWFLAYDIGFLAAYLLVSILILTLGSFLCGWWFEGGHPCACPDSGKYEYGSSKHEERKRCPRHNSVTSGRHFNVCILLGAVVLIANFVLMLELFHYLHLGR